MVKDDRIEYWIELSEYDLETARAMLDTKRYLYVGFMCQQVVEKALKGYYVFSQDAQPPYIHNLTKISEKANIYNEYSEDQKDFIELLEPLNITARYPENKEKLSKSMTEAKCKVIIEKTEELLKWIKEKL